MEYRRLGSAGIKVSEVSFGSWITFDTQLDDGKASKCMTLAYDSGINFFDNAEAYARGRSEEIMGRVLKQMKWRRASYVVSTKFYWGLHEGPNEKNTLNRKYLSQAINGSLARLGLDYIDLVFCHRPDPHTPMEETVRAMHDMIAQGKALYWGTSEWSAEQIQEAYTIADKLHLHKPQMEQPQYNLFARERVEQEYANLYDSVGLGLTTWSPLASGALTGKYLAGVPAGSRAQLPGYEWLRERILAEEKLEKVRKFVAIAAELNVTPAQLAIAWCLKNQRVSSVILGATTLEQLKENLVAPSVVQRLDSVVMDRINSAMT